MKLRPVRDYPEQDYPRASDRLVKSLFLAVTMTATSLGGCGPIGDYPVLDAAAEMHDLDGTVDAPAPDKSEVKPLDVDKGEAVSRGVDGK
jgi:hypothetical protein